MKTKLSAIALIWLPLLATLSFLNVNAEPAVLEGKLTAPCGIMPFGGEKVGSFEMTVDKIGDKKRIDNLMVDMNKPAENGTYVIGFSSHGPNLLNKSILDIDEYRSGGKLMIVKGAALPSPYDLLFVKESENNEHAGAALLLPAPENPVLEPKQVEYRNAKIVHSLNVEKQEYRVGERIDIKPQLMNIGSESVNITHGNPLFAITAYTSEGEYAWIDPWGGEDVGHGTTLQPLVAYSGREYQLERYDIRFCTPGEYTLVSYADFRISPQDLKVYAEPVTIRINPLELGRSITLSAPVLMDQEGNKVDSITCGKSVSIRSEVANHSSVEHRFVHIVKISDEQGFTQFIGLEDNLTLLHDGTLNPVSIWLTEEKGIFSVEVFVWSDLESPMPLTPKQSTPIRVTC